MVDGRRWYPSAGWAEFKLQHGTEECFTCTLDMEYSCYSELGQCFTKTNECISSQIKDNEIGYVQRKKEVSL